MRQLETLYTPQLTMTASNKLIQTKLKKIHIFHYFHYHREKQQICEQLGELFPFFIHCMREDKSSQKQIPSNLVNMIKCFKLALIKKNK